MQLFTSRFLLWDEFSNTISYTVYFPLLKQEEKCLDIMGHLKLYGSWSQVDVI